MAGGRERNLPGFLDALGMDAELAVIAALLFEVLAAVYKYARP